HPESLVGDAMISSLVVAHPDEILRSVADRMAATGDGVHPMLDRADVRHPDVSITQFDLFGSRQKLVEEERHAERVLTLRRVNTSRRNGELVSVEDPSESAGVD
ncbi:MAG: hypothetical protein ACYCXY_13110, partial [Acidimicrobiales bacterium]